MKEIIFCIFLKKHGNKDDYTHICKMKNQVQKEIRIAKSNFFSDKIEESKNDSKGFWQYLKHFEYKWEKRKAGRQHCFEHSENCHEAEKIANYFNSSFTNKNCISVGSKIS